MNVKKLLWRKTMNVKIYKRGTRLSRIAFCLLVAVASVSVAAAQDEKIDKIQQGFTIKNVQNWTANGNVVPVCWETPGYNREKAIVRAAVSNTWEKFSSVRFTGWAACPTGGIGGSASAQHVRIRIRDQDSSNAGAGGSARYGMSALSSADDNNPGVNFSFNPDGTADKGRVEYIAVHEFGHVLGFVHEQDTPGNVDGPTHCDSLGNEPNATSLTDYDPDSIMNYCNKDGNMKGNLTDKDINGLQAVYGYTWQNWFRVTDGGGLKAPVTALTPRSDHVDLFVTGNDGYVYSTFHEAAAGWQKWFRIGNLKIPTQSPVTALATRPGHIDLFVVGSDNGVYSTYHEAQGGWRPWFKIGYVGVGARSTIAAIQSSPGHIDLFVVGTDSKVYSTYHDGGNWKDWFTITEMRSPPGSSVTALSPAAGHIDLFVSGMEGGVYTTIHPAGGDWQRWLRLGNVEMLPGSPVTALYTRPDHLDLFVVDKDKKVFSIFRGSVVADRPVRWQDWFRVINLEAVPGTRVAALATRPDHLDLFAVGTDGGVYSTYHESNGGWRPWFKITNMVSTPGAAVTALAARPDHIDLFVSGLDSGVYSTSHQVPTGPSVK